MWRTQTAETSQISFWCPGERISQPLQVELEFLMLVQVLLFYTYLWSATSLNFFFSVYVLPFLNESWFLIKKIYWICCFGFVLSYWSNIWIDKLLKMRLIYTIIAIQCSKSLRSRGILAYLILEMNTMHYSTAFLQFLNNFFSACLLLIRMGNLLEEFSLIF